MGIFRFLLRIFLPKMRTIEVDKKYFLKYNKRKEW